MSGVGSVLVVFGTLAQIVAAHPDLVILYPVHLNHNVQEPDDVGRHVRVAGEP